VTPLLWVVAGGVAGGLVLLVKSAKATPKSSTNEPVPPAPPPPLTFGETKRVALAVPSGWRRVTNAEVSSEILSRANALRDTSGFKTMPYGTLAPFTSGGKTYATWIEQHFHEPGGAAKPWGLHHGVTLLTKA
jgi:hypothetical protein